MLKPTLLLILGAATLSAAAQNAAPIVRHYRPSPTTFSPAEGIRVTSDSKVETVSATAAQTELRLAHGSATVYVDHPSDDALILVNLPAGQADLVRDGVYLLDADTNTLTVIRGEADVFPLGAPTNAKGTTTKEGQQITLGSNSRPEYTSEARAYTRDNRESDRSYGNDGYGSSYYGDGYYGGYPGYGYGWGYPYYGYGYPGFGLGFGYGWGGYGYGGFGYRGGFGGFRGGRGFRR